MDISNYTIQQDERLLQKIRELSSKLPPVCNDYVTYVTRIKTKRTAVEYVRDLVHFFEFISSDIFKKDVSQITFSDVEKIEQYHVEQYLTKISAYRKQVGSKEKYIQNTHASINRKLSSIKSFFRYNYRVNNISRDKIQFVDHFKLKDHKEPVSLDLDEIKRLYHALYTGDSTKSNQAKKYHDLTYIRDIAIITTLLGTGVRVSELVGINFSDIDWYECSIEIQRKGQWKDLVYFGPEVEAALEDYLQQRNLIIPREGSEDALFLSTQKRRISARSVEILVKKYKNMAGIDKKITPHKLRSTYGTELYEQTSDIMLVRDSLGHSNVQTTMRYVSRSAKLKRQNAANKFKIKGR